VCPDYISLQRPLQACGWHGVLQQVPQPQKTGVAAIRLVFNEKRNLCLCYSLLRHPFMTCFDHKLLDLLHPTLINLSHDQNALQGTWHWDVASKGRPLATEMALDDGDDRVSGRTRTHALGRVPCK
jgi:hypothetical protein